MKRLDFSKNIIFNTLEDEMKLNPNTAWNKTFLVFQECLNNLYTYDEKAELFDYFDELKNEKQPCP